eukprot:1305640-Pyramimonas_sp.AAC.1
MCVACVAYAYILPVPTLSPSCIASWSIMEQHGAGGRRGHGAQHGARRSLRGQRQEAPAGAAQRAQGPAPGGGGGGGLRGRPGGLLAPPPPVGHAGGVGEVRAGHVSHRAGGEEVRGRLRLEGGGGDRPHRPAQQVRNHHPLRGGLMRDSDRSELGGGRLHRGVDEAYDAAQEQVADAEAHLKAFLKEQQQRAKCGNMKFVDLNKDVYLLQLPAAAAQK